MTQEVFNYFEKFSSWKKSLNKIDLFWKKMLLKK